MRKYKTPTIADFDNWTPSIVVYSGRGDRIVCEVRDINRIPSVVFVLTRADGTEVCETSLEKLLTWL